MMKLNWKSGLAIVATMLGVAYLVAWFMFGRVSRFDAEEPKAETPPLPPLKAQQSKITLPVSIPIDAVRDILEQTVPREQTGREAYKERIDILIGSTSVDIRIDWKVNRTDFEVAGDNDTLRVKAGVSGQATVRAKYKGPSASADITLQGTASLDARPRLDSKWHLTTPELSMDIRLNRAKVKVGPVSVSVRGKIRPKLNSFAKEQRDKIKRRIAEDGSLRTAAKENWEKFCRSVSLGSDTGLWLEIKPVAARTAQPRISNENISLQLGLDAETRVVTKETNPDCPFPEELFIEAPQLGYIEIVLPVEIDYLTLETALENEIVGKTFGKDISVRVETVSVRPHGGSLLLKVEVAVQVADGGWFDSRAEGTLYLLARPQLVADSQMITLTDVQLDTASRDVLVAIIGEAVEPLLLRAVEGQTTLDLEPKYREIRDRANAALKAFSSDDLAVDGEIEDVRLTSVDVGPDRLRVVANARGRVAVVVRKIPQSGH